MNQRVENLMLTPAPNPMVPTPPRHAHHWMLVHKEVAKESTFAPVTETIRYRYKCICGLTLEDDNGSPVSRP